MDKPDLIRTVRGLDQTGPGANGENLQLLWSCLAAATDVRFHAAEESSLRWLLKSMNGASPGAETLRRYPLTWTILDCVLQRIPLFSLAKSLADRKFIAVLQQTLTGISRPAAKPVSPASSKRKKTPTISYVLEDLQAPDGCLESARAVFGALKSLLSRLECPEAGFSRDQIGAEHIKSLFCTSATEATKIVAPALVTCSNLLASDSCVKIEGAERWIETISTIWDLHLQGSDDVVEVAIHLFRPSAIILDKTGAFSASDEIDVPNPLKDRWSADLQTFIQRNLILPGRASFITHRVLEPFVQALEITKSIIQLSAPALYFLISGMPDGITEGERRKDNVEFTRQIFRSIEARINGRPDRSTLLQVILELAIQQSTPIDVADLRRVCREYALQGTETDWELVAKVAVCDPDVFQLSDDGTNLRREVCNRTVKPEAAAADRKAISRLIGAIMDGFRTRRGLPSFLRLWFEQLCEVERHQLDAHSPWFQVGQSTSPTKLLGSWIDNELSPPQLLDVVSSIETQNAKMHPRSICLFASTFAQALQSESLVGAVGRRLFDLAVPIDCSAGASALKWRVVSHTMSWIPSGERLEMWNLIKDRLDKALQTAPVISGEAFEAFKCCYHIWDIMSPDDAHIDEAASLIETFTERLAIKIGPSAIGDGDKLSCAEPDMRAELQEELAYQQYLAWYLYGSSRFIKLYFGKKSELPPILLNALSNRKARVDELHSLWQALLRNETTWNEAKLARDLVDRLITALDDSGKEKGWPGERGQLWIKSLATIPIQVYSRGQREKLMHVLIKRRAKMIKSPEKVSGHGWRLVLDLETKMMRRPTFYDGMRFSHLVDMAAALSSISMESSATSEVLLELVERFFVMASATIRQMAENMDDRSIRYFGEAFKFVSDCEAQATAHQQASDSREPLFMTLLRALAAELARSPNCRSHEELGPLTQRAKTVLAKCILDAIGNFISDKELLASSSTVADMNLFAAVDAARTVEDFTALIGLEPSAVRKLEKRSRNIMQQGDLKGWKIQVFLRSNLSAVVGAKPLTAYSSLESVESRFHEPLLKDLVTSMTRNMDSSGRCQYLEKLVDSFHNGCDTDGQILAIQTVVDEIIDSTDFQGRAEGFSLAATHGELMSSLLRQPPHATRICRILRTLLEKRPRAMSQWNIETTLGTVCALSATNADQSVVPFTWLCKLVEAVIKKHRLRLEGHYHILLSVMQALLRNLVMKQLPTSSGDEASQRVKAHMYARLITLVCEPTAGAVARSQLHSALDSTTDAAKRSAGRHMYVVMMQYVKLQLEETVPRAVREALEPAMNSIFDITSPEGRKILNDALDDSGRAILREMYKRYVKFGKWTGV